MYTLSKDEGKEADLSGRSIGVGIVRIVEIGIGEAVVQLQPLEDALKEKRYPGCYPVGVHPHNNMIMQ